MRLDTRVAAHVGDGRSDEPGFFRLPGGIYAVGFYEDMGVDVKHEEEAGQLGAADLWAPRRIHPLPF